MKLDKEIVRKIDDIERLAYEIASATWRIRYPESPFVRTVSAKNIACSGTDARKFQSNAITADSIVKAPLDVKTYPLKLDLQIREKEPDVTITDEYRKGDTTVLEMRFPDTEAGWEHWRKLVDTVRRFETGFSARIEEIEPGKLKAVIRLS